MLTRIRMLTAIAATAVLAASCASGGHGHPAGTTPDSGPATGASTPPPTHHSTTPPPPTRAELRARARRSVARLESGQPAGAVSVAAVNTVTGARFSAGRRSGMWTASAYKLYVLEALLLRTGGELSSGEIDDATRAIENSDNVAGYQLFLDAGGNPGLESAAERLGMRHTVPGASDPTFTRTGAPDCLALLRALVHPGLLDAQSRSFVLGLMRNVEDDQRWGVGTVADPGSTFYNKNGWLSVDDSNGPGEDDDGRWVTTSLGIVRIHGQQVLMAVLTEHQPSYDDGVRLVQHLARAIAPAVAKP